MFHRFKRCFRLRPHSLYSPPAPTPSQEVTRICRSLSISSNYECLCREIKVNLYPKEDDPTILTIYESSSMQQVFDAFTSIKDENLLPKYSSQSLVTLWDIQKFMFRIGHLFEASPSQDFLSQDHYIHTLRQHPTLQQIVSHIIDHCEELEDEALAASFLCLHRLKFSIRGPECQKIINSMLQRKANLALPALSRLCVVLKSESLYGYAILTEFSPLLHWYVQNMSTDEDVRLVSISVRCAYNILSRKMLDDYTVRLNEILSNGSVTLDPLSLCKVLMFLFERQLSYQVTLKEKDRDTMLAAKLLRQCGNLLIPHVDKMGELDILNLSKFIEFQKEPAGLIQALTDRVSRLAEEAVPFASAELMSCIQPVTLDQKIKLGAYLKEKLEDYDKFSRISHFAFRIFKKTPFDKELYDRFWFRYQHLLETGAQANAVNAASWEETESAENDDDDDWFVFGSEGSEKIKFLKCAVKYINIRSQICRSYRHHGFERTVSHLILEYLQSYEDGKCVITPGEYAKAMAFLIAAGHKVTSLKPSFVQHFRVPDLILVYRGLQLNPRMPFEVSDALDKRSRSLLKEDLTAIEYLGLGKINLRTQQVFEVHPAFMQCIDAAIKVPWNDSRSATDVLSNILSSGYHCQEAFDRVSKFVCDVGEDVSVKCVEKLALASYLCGIDSLDCLPIVGRIIERTAERTPPLSLVQSMLSLCFHGLLNVELIHKVFSVDFLDEVDKQIKVAGMGTRLPLKLRDAFMRLNRAVCIDMPEANVPWFHEKYCQEVAAVESRKMTYLHQEVNDTLTEIMGPGSVSSNQFSPYYYPLDFVLLFDESGCPLSSNAVKEAASKVAVLVHQPKDYTCGERRLKGPHRLKRRHLEILGYRVIDIDPFDWNSMGLSEKVAKNSYLQECIYGT